MSKVTWWALAASVFVALIIMIVTFVVMRMKIKKVKEQYRKQIDDIATKENKALLRENPGELLWELKSKSLNPLEDISMEFLINTCVRNEYKTFFVVNSESNYEEETLIKIAKMQKNIEQSDFVLMFNNQDINKMFDEKYQKIAQGKMIAIVNAIRSDKQIKELLKYLKLIDAKYEWINYDKGIILVVK